MTTTAVSTRRVRGINPKTAGLQQSPREKGSNLPEYLERVEIEAVITAAPNPVAKWLMLEQWWAGLRVSEAPALEKRDLSLDSDPRFGSETATKPWCYPCSQSRKPR